MKTLYEKEAMDEAVKFIEDLCILLKPPAGATDFFHGKIPLNRQDSIDYTVDAAMKFCESVKTATVEVP